MGAYREARAVPAKMWINARTNERASIHGAPPWFGDSEQGGTDWAIKTVGWTVECVSKRGNVTYGAGRPAVKTEAEAAALAAQLTA